MEKDQIEITVTMSKTIQEKQFEPLVLSLSAKMMTNNENVDEDLVAGFELIEEMITEKFAARGIKW
jgi:hypothetical protein